MSGKHIINEEVLAKECLAGNRFAQRQLYELYADPMMITCLRYIPDSADAKEIMLDGFTNAYRNIDRFEYRGAGSLKAWLKKIIVNQCLMFIRKNRQAPVQVNDPDGHYDQPVDMDIMGRLHVKELLNMIQELPDGYRTVFNLYTFENMTHKEISMILNISENTSKSQLHKAKGLLQKKILNNKKAI